MTGGPTGHPRPLEWIGSSKKNLMALPAQVVDVFGYALYLAQTGERPDQAKPLSGLGSAGALEVVEDWRGDAYRAVQAWHRDAEGGHGSDQREIEGRGCAGLGA